MSLFIYFGRYVVCVRCLFSSFVLSFFHYSRSYGFICLCLSVVPSFLMPLFRSLFLHSVFRYLLSSLCM